MFELKKYPFCEHNRYDFDSDFFRINFINYCIPEGVSVVKSYVCKKEFFGVIFFMLSSVFSEEQINTLLDSFGRYIGDIFANDDIEHITSPKNRREFLDLMCHDFIDEYIIKPLDRESKMFLFETDPFDDPTIPPSLIVVLSSEKTQVFKDCDSRAAFIHS